VTSRSGAESGRDAAGELDGSALARRRRAPSADRHGAPGSGKLRPARAVSDTLDSTLIVRLRQVLASDRVTESELRELTEQADGWARALEARVRAAERKLSMLAGRDGSMTEIADELRRVELLRPELDEVRLLRAGLDARARELRTAWLRAATRQPRR
jgi:hypothetical protein